MDFKQASLAEADTIANLHIENWRETYRGALTDHYLDHEIWVERRQDWDTRLRHPAANQFVLMALDNDQLAGFVCAYGNHHPKFGTLIENLHASQSYRGKGIGKKLFLAAAAWSLQSYPDVGLYLEVVSSNTAAISFYSALGGTHVESNIWTPPGGGELLEFSYYWEDLAQLLGKRNR